jgi:low affinity Fe/Cu permease
MAAPELSIFDRFARSTEHLLGHPAAFAVACLSIILWAATGVIQNTQNRDTRALQMKLDELIRVNKAARNSLMGLEERPECEIKELKSTLAESVSVGGSAGERDVS